ncbi:MAG: carboxypeptidase-like regulatory domain-containing protein, partial [Candidatus Marinimicrobia bacterium]|nr:carboxypeptidase-like regulatory domain-containing protein [Candidatus Neomarinimicrobiota bacterium]
MRKAIRSVLFTFSLLLASRAVAGVTGKIQGQVTDVNSAPLPGANVMLVGANRGAAADALGNYIILSVPPGNYDLAVQVIGYERVVQLGVLVNVDRTTHVDFQLAMEAVGLEQVEVTAERSKVAVDRTFSEYIVNSEDINRSVMLKSVGDLISMEPGMDIQGRGMIRGGDMNSIAADVVYYVDGIKMVNSDGMSLHNFTGVGKYDIESLSIITGGLSAEY